MAAAIASWFLCPVVLAVVALVLAHSADQTIDASAGSLGGRGLVTAARVVAWIHLALAALAVALGLAVLVGVLLGAS